MAARLLIKQLIDCANKAVVAKVNLVRGLNTAYITLHISTWIVIESAILIFMATSSVDFILRKGILQPKYTWCKKSCGQESKKGHAEKDVKSK